MAGPFVAACGVSAGRTCPIQLSKSAASFGGRRLPDFESGRGLGREAVAGRTVWSSGEASVRRGGTDVVDQCWAGRGRSGPRRRGRERRGGGGQLRVLKRLDCAHAARPAGVWW